ncbi:hypothetical protein ACG95P_12965 [Acinetobacter guillouiae]|uniref:hypothetical protein n=1 Tax=Acinetobacter guillouiae TaxID=106649 RepID=UPI003AF80476
MGDLINFEKPAKIITLFFDPNDPELRAEIESADQMVSYDINSMSMNELRNHARCSIVLMHREQIRHLKEIATIERKDPVLDAPARVGGLTFRKGIMWSTVIEATQRHYKYSLRNEKPIVSPADMLKIASGELVLVPKEKIGSLVNELHTAFQSIPILTLGELLPLQQDFQAMIEAREQSHGI